MSTLKLYLKFRRELDSMWVPMALDNLKVKQISYRGRLAGILCTVDNYIDCLYIKPEHRRKGLGKQTVLRWLQANDYPFVKLHIINNNKAALEFWKSIFTLTPLEVNEIDTLYRGELYGNT